jgi:hypothetical protein
MASASRAVQEPADHPQPPPEPGGELDKFQPIGYSASVWLETRQVVGGRRGRKAGFRPQVTGARAGAMLNSEL